MTAKYFLSVQGHYAAVSVHSNFLPAMQIDGAAPKLDGIVECDETFIGSHSTTRLSRITKANVAALVQRNGQVRTRIVSSVSQKLMRIFVTDCVSKTAILNTDEHQAHRLQSKSARDFRKK